MTPAAESSVRVVEHTLFLTLVQVAIMVTAARCAGSLARRIGQPRAVGEIVAGLLLGPSCFGALAPDTFHLIFQSTDPMPIRILAELGLILLMFQIGLEFDFSHLKSGSNRFAVSLISIVGTLFPFACGLAFGYLSAPHLAPGIAPLPYSLFVATACSITAIPVLGRIMFEFNLTQTRLGAIAISAAAVNDAAGWILLAFISALVAAQLSVAGIVKQVGLFVLYVLLCWFAVRRVLRYLARRFEFDAHNIPHDLMAIVLVTVFASAMVTSKLGIFAIFGGFMMGVLLHDNRTFVEAWRRKVGDLVTVLLLPIFFTYTGLRTDVGGLHSPQLWLWCAGAIATAILGKFGGCYVAGRIAGLRHPEAGNVAIMMNARALMELVALNLGYDMGYVPQTVFTMLVLMALVSTVMTAPALRRWLPRIGHAVAVRADA